MRQSSDWDPVISLSPVTSQTLVLSVTNATLLEPMGLSARLFIEGSEAAAAISMTLMPDGTYSATFHTDIPALEGKVQVYVNETGTEDNPRREAMTPFAVGGNPGYSRIGGGGYSRIGGGASARSGNAPLLSPDGSLIYFTRNEITFTVGTLFTVQSMSGLPDIPSGRTLVGQAYRILASPGATLPDGSISLQYYQTDVTNSGLTETDLQLYYYDGAAWQALETIVDSYYNLASSPSSGPGIYALLASIRLPLEGPGWNLVAYPLRETRPVTEALASIDGFYARVYGYDASDTLDPWKLYDVNVPSWVNDLYDLQFGSGYWISATQPVTAYFGGLWSNAPQSSLSLGLPPATFYGRLLGTQTFRPQPGSIVEAWIDGRLCGQGTARQVGGEIVYAVDVLAAEGSTSGCGAPGRQVSFQVDGQTLPLSAAWTDARAQRLDLWLGLLRLFLPLVNRQG